MSTAKCSRKKQNYAFCGHTLLEYTYCGDGHPNTNDENEACYEDKSPPPDLTETPPALPAFCNKFCQAEHKGWYCCQCPSNLHVTSHLDETTQDVVHLTSEGEEHRFCSECTAADV